MMQVISRGALALVAWVLVGPGASAQTATIVHDFDASGGTDGFQPHAGVMQDNVGNLWGTTTQGGAYGKGTVFEIAANGSYSVEHSFGSGSDGVEPFAGIMQDNAGNLWGTTYGGGTYAKGTVFEIAPSGSYFVVHSFGYDQDGRQPYAGLLQDSAGNIWGTSTQGGESSKGTVFEIAASGTYSVVYSFGKDYANVKDGHQPYAGLVQDSAGNLWGTTYRAGAYRMGTVFEIAANGSYSVVHSFGKGKDGGGPYGSLTLDNAGNLWGTTYGGGAYGKGTVFSINLATGAEAVVYSFDTSANDGTNPYASLLNVNGELFGTTYYGGNGQGCGSSGCGTVFSITP